MNLDSIEYRSANMSDAPGLALVLDRADAKRDGYPVPSTLEGDLGLEDMRSRMIRHVGSTTLTALHDESIVGFSLSYPYMPETMTVDSDTQHLSLLMVDPDYWGNHIGSHLLDLTVEHAQAKGKRRLTLWTNAQNNERALALYASRGFVLNGNFEIRNGKTQAQHELSL